MIARLLIALLLAVPAFSASRLTLGPEIEVGSSDPVIPEATYYRAAMATDGETTLVVHVVGPSHGAAGALFGTRIDGSGRVLDPQPIVLVARTATTGAMPYTDPHVLWYRDHYLVFYVNETRSMRVLRVTREGHVVERVTLESQIANAIPWTQQFDVATDGNEIVLVSQDTRVVRLGSDLKPVGEVLAIVQPPSSYDRARGIAYGDGRFAIVSSYSDRVVAQFLENGALTAPVFVSEANIDRVGVVRVAWTGSRFIAAWTECSDEDACLSVWTPLAPTGAAVGPIRAIEYGHIEYNVSYRYDITLTVLDENTVFFTWRDEDQTVALGRRYRVSGTPVGDAVNFGTGPLAAMRAPSGALAVFDSRRRLAWIESPSNAVLPPTVPLVPAVVAPAGQAVVAAASSKSEIAIVHDSYGGGFNSNNYVTVASFDGLSARHVPIGPAFATAIASDGEQFYMLRNLWFGPLTFEILGTSTKVELASRGWAVRLLWTGEEFLAIWSDVDGKEFLARLDRTGKVLSLPRPLDSSQILSFVEKDGRVLLGSYKSPGIEVAVLDAHGNPIGAPEQMTLLNPYGGFALATTGDTDAFAGVSSNFDDLVLGVRPRNGVFVRSATTPEPPPPSRMLNDDGVAIAAIDDRFVVAFTVHAPVLPATHIALLEKQGLATGAVVMPAGTAGRTLLVEIAPGRLVLVYARVLDEPRYAGLTRVFMRAVSFTGESASATERAASRRQ